MLEKKKWRPPPPSNGGLKWIGGYRDERMENRFWGEEGGSWHS